MPRNNSHARREQRKRGANERLADSLSASLSVAEREAERGYPAKLEAQKNNSK